MESPKPKTTVKRKTKAVDGGQVAAKCPEWYDVYWVMSEAGDSLLQSLTKRDDIPEDAKDIIKAVACLKESRDLFFAEGKSLTPYSALFWMEELKKWASRNSAELVESSEFD
jgi:hypothetical protein